MHTLYSLRFWLIAAFIACVAACSNQPPADIHLQGRTMGTLYNVKYSGEGLPDKDQLQAEVDKRLAYINSLMSTYDPQSELSRFNQSDITEPQAMSAEIMLVMREAVRLGELSNGKLDVTVGPLVNLWGFGPQARPKRVPTDADVRVARAKSGLDKLLLNENGAQKLHPELYVDLSTIAKGYGVDSIAELLESHGITNYLVEIGGEMRVSGLKANKQPWRIAIEKPVTTERAVQRIVSIGDNAIATSGDYRNYYERDGKRYSHLIDPVSGFPIEHNLVSVTVVHPSSMTADGLATALNVMGKDAALKVAEQNNLAVLLITRENGEYKEYTSAQFSTLVTVVK